MRARRWLTRFGAICALASAPALPAFAQGKGYGVGEWNLYTGGSVCRVVLTERFIPSQSNYRAYVQPDGRCTDWRVRNLAMWVVRGNDLKLGDNRGSEIAALAQQGPNLYASGEWQLRRVGTGPGPGPGPGYVPPGDRPGQGIGPGDWSFVNQSNGSVCQISLTNRLVPEQSAYRAFPRGGPRCNDWMAQSVAFWVVKGNSLHLSDGSGREIAKLEQNGPNQYAAGCLILQRRRGGY